MTKRHRRLKLDKKNTGAWNSLCDTLVPRWASQSDVRFVVLKRRDTLALIASRWRKDKMHEASKAFGTSNGVALAGHSGKKARGALPTADLAYVRDQCRQLQEVDKLNDRLLRGVPSMRKLVSDGIRCGRLTKMMLFSLIKLMIFLIVNRPRVIYLVG